MTHHRSRLGDVDDGERRLGRESDEPPVGGPRVAIEPQVVGEVEIGGDPAAPGVEELHALIAAGDDPAAVGRQGRLTCAGDSGVVEDLRGLQVQARQAEVGLVGVAVHDVVARRHQHRPTVPADADRESGVVAAHGYVLAVAVTQGDHLHLTGAAGAADDGDGAVRGQHGDGGIALVLRDGRRFRLVQAPVGAAVGAQQHRLRGVHELDPHTVLVQQRRGGEAVLGQHARTPGVARDGRREERFVRARRPPGVPPPSGRVHEAEDSDRHQQPDPDRPPRGRPR